MRLRLQKIVKKTKASFVVGGQMCPSGGCWLEKQRSADDMARRPVRRAVAYCSWRHCERFGYAANVLMRRHVSRVGRGNAAARGNATHNGGNGPLARETRPSRKNAFKSRYI